MRLVGLPDTKGVIEADGVSSFAAVLRALRAGHAATTAGDDGAINIWRDDNGKLRGEVMRFMITQDSQTFNNQALIAPWFRKWFTIIHRM